MYTRGWCSTTPPWKIRLLYCEADGADGVACDDPCGQKMTFGPDVAAPVRGAAEALPVAPTTAASTSALAPAIQISRHRRTGQPTSHRLTAHTTTSPAPSYSPVSSTFSDGQMSPTFGWSYRCGCAGLALDSSGPFVSRTTAAEMSQKAASRRPARRQCRQRWA